MKRRGKAVVLFLTLALAAGGCGEKPITLTPEEESMIVHYAAHVVSKYNTRQPDGLCHVRDEEEETELPPENTESMEEPDTEEEQQGESRGGESSEDPNEQQPVADETLTLTEALGLDGISAECTGAEIKASYIEPDYYALDASAGNTFVILHISLTNTTDKDIVCDMLSEQMSFAAVINGGLKAKARTTILLNDLGTYQDTIAAKTSVDTVLFFEVPAEEVASVDSVRLTVEKNGKKTDSVL